MSRFLKVFLVLLMVAACSEKKDVEELAIVKADGQVVIYNVEVAEGKEKIATGLMNRKSLDADSGMIFDLSILTTPTIMWMKDTLIPLDMLFLDKDGHIYWYYKNAEPLSEKLIVAPYPARAVVELNAGEIEKNNIQIGDVIKFRYFENFSEEPVPAEVEVIEAKDMIDETLDGIDDYDSEIMDIEDNGQDEETIILD